MPEIAFIVDDVTGDVLLEHPERLAPEVLAEFTALLGRPREVGCARPLEVLPPPEATAEEQATTSCVRGRVLPPLARRGAGAAQRGAPTIVPPGMPEVLGAAPA